LKVNPESLKTKEICCCGGVQLQLTKHFFTPSKIKPLDQYLLVKNMDIFLTKEKYARVK
jgi:hypothetical protein